MKRFAATFALALFLGSMAFCARAASDVRFDAGEIAFSLPDAWDSKGSSPNRSPPKMDVTDPLFFTWKRTAITGKSGNAVTAGVNITVYTVQADTNITLLSILLMQRRGWPLKQFLTLDKDGLTLPNSLGYVTEFSPREGLNLQLLVVHVINNKQFIEITFSATDEIFAQVEPEFRHVLKSLRFVR